MLNTTGSSTSHRGRQRQAQLQSVARVGIEKEKPEEGENCDPAEADMAKGIFAYSDPECLNGETVGALEIRPANRARADFATR